MKRGIILIFALLSGLFLVSCGDDDDKGDNKETKKHTAVFEVNSNDPLHFQTKVEYYDPATEKMVSKVMEENPIKVTLTIPGAVVYTFTVYSERRDKDDVTAFPEVTLKISLDNKEIYNATGTKIVSHTFKTE